MWTTFVVNKQAFESKHAPNLVSSVLLWIYAVLGKWPHFTPCKWNGSEMSIGGNTWWTPWTASCRLVVLLNTQAYPHSGWRQVIGQDTQTRYGSLLFRIQGTFSTLWTDSRVGFLDSVSVWTAYKLIWMWTIYIYCNCIEYSYIVWWWSMKSFWEPVIVIYRRYRYWGS